jgi:hypothetical protein
MAITLSSKLPAPTSGASQKVARRAQRRSTPGSNTRGLLEDIFTGMEVIENNTFVAV